MEQPRPKQKLWFDPKNPPKTPVYVGQKIPIYIVPDETQEDDRLVEPTWKKTDWYFRIVGIRRINVDEDGKKVEQEVVDVEWPNKRIDRDIPISDMYGHFGRIRESWIPQFTEDYDSEEEDVEIIDLSKAKTNQEKLEQLLKMLQFLSEQRERIRQEGDLDEEKPTVTVEETSDEPTVLQISDNPVLNGSASEPVLQSSPEPKEPAPISLDIERLQQLLPDLSLSAIQSLRAMVEKSELESQNKQVPESKDDPNDEPLEDPNDEPNFIQLTKTMIKEWFQIPSKGGLRIGDLRSKAHEYGIKDSQKLKRSDLKAAFMVLADS